MMIGEIEDLIINFAADHLETGQPGR